MENILIIGYGKLGSHLYYALKKSPQFKISGVIKNSLKKINPALVNNSNIIFICTQDNKIPVVTKKLSDKSFSLKSKYVYHTSGSLNSDVLVSLGKKGANTGSFHPVQTFEAIAKKDLGRFKKKYIAVEGNKKAVKKAQYLARSIKAIPFEISKNNKVYHHICCVVASNYTASLMRVIEKIAAKKIRINGFKNFSFFNIYKPLAEQTLENIAKKGAAKSLTGPIERNDMETVTSHLKALTGEFFPVYLLLGLETVKLALEKKSITFSDADKLLKSFDKYIKINKIR
jgi:predicted short-subunit dehydrogenase-like oxidoreductase (DUF2520 family)